MTVGSGTRLPVLMRAGRASVPGGARLASWAGLLGPPHPEDLHARRMAHLGGLTAFFALVLYLTWRLVFTLPVGGHLLVAALLLILFEAVPLIGITWRMVTLWNVDTVAPDPVTSAGPGHRAAVFIPTAHEPVEVIAPTIAAACELQPAHQTWVLDEGDRPWVAELANHCGARYVRREVHVDGKAGNLNHALTLLQAEVVAGAEPVDVIAVLDADHVPLPTFLTTTLGWFDDPEIALVQAPHSYYNLGAFDDDGDTGEQGMFFHVELPARSTDRAGPFWCGSTALLRTEALHEIGGVSTGTVGEDVHTTLHLLRAGWRTTFHHQVLAVGLAPSTPDQYLRQRRRSGIGAMQILVREGLWAPGRWLSWRSYHAYLSATLSPLAGVATAAAFFIPAALLVSGAPTSTASPLTFALAFSAMFALRMWGATRLFRRHLHWRTAFALRILRIPVGLSCLWWLLTRRRPLRAAGPPGAPPRSGASGRTRGKIPRVLWGLVVLTALVLGYGVLGATGLVPWRVSVGSAVASGVWLVLALVALTLGLSRIHDVAYATSRRIAYRAPVHAPVYLNGQRGELVDVSVGGAAVQLPHGALPETTGLVTLNLPGAWDLQLETVRVRHADGVDHVALRVPPDDWDTYRALALWLFHTPPGVVDGLPPQAPAVAATLPVGRSRRPVLIRQHG